MSTRALPPGMHRCHWWRPITEQEAAQIRLNAPRFTVRKLSPLLHRSPATLRDWGYRNGVKFADGRKAKEPKKPVKRADVERMMQLAERCA